MAKKYTGNVRLHHVIATGGSPKSAKTTSGDVSKSGVRGKK
jgi:hypothetical protein